jgi:hypothetical protein
VTIGTAVAVIPPGELRIECPRIRLHYVPGEVLTLPYIFYKRPRKLTSDNQIVEIPDSVIPCFMKGIEYWGHFNNGDLDFAKAAQNDFYALRNEQITLSEKELKKENKKIWNESFGNPKFFLPRTIDAEVTA